MRRSEISELYRRYGPLIYSRFRRVLKDERLAAEATVEAFEQLLAASPPPSDEQAVRFIASKLAR